MKIPKLNLQLHAGEEKNKVRFGLKNAHYAVITETDGEITYGTPKPLPGSVALVLNTVGDKTEFFADDGEYFGATVNQGYEGTLELALIPDEFKKDVLKEIEDANGVLFEDSNAIPNKIALLYQFAGDKKATRHVNYHCTVARPSQEAQTKGASIEPNTETIPITATPHPKNGYVKARALQGQEGYETFFEEVYEFAQEQEPDPET